MKTQLPMLRVALVVVCFFSCPANSEDVATSTWRCVSGAYERSIALFRNDGPERSASGGTNGTLACRVVYTKDGDSRTLWRASNDPAYCEPRVRSLVERLRQSGFQCALTENSVDSSSTGPGGARGAVGPVMRPDHGSDAIRNLLARHYEGDYLKAMVAAIPPGFSVHPDTDALTAGLGGALRVGPPNHFVKTMADGSYVLVNTLRLEDSGTASFVNLGFMVSDQRYRFLGYATVHSATDAVVQDADGGMISVIVTTRAAPACELSRGLQSLRWSSTLAVHYPNDSEVDEVAWGCSD